METIDELISTINSDITMNIVDTLKPFIDRMKYSEKCYNIVKKILYEFPEFKELKKENEYLKSQLDNLTESDSGEGEDNSDYCNPKPKLKITVKKHSPIVTPEFNSIKNSVERQITPIPDAIPDKSEVCDNKSSYTIIIPSTHICDEKIDNNEKKTPYSDLSTDESGEPNQDVLTCDTSSNELPPDVSSNVNIDISDKESYDSTSNDSQCDADVSLGEENVDSSGNMVDEVCGITDDDVKKSNMFIIEMEDEDGNPLKYYTKNEESGKIYEVTDNESIGESVGYFEDGEPLFYEDE